MLHVYVLVNKNMVPLYYLLSKIFTTRSITFTPFTFVWVDLVCILSLTGLTGHIKYSYLAKRVMSQIGPTGCRSISNVQNLYNFLYLMIYIIIELLLFMNHKVCGGHLLKVGLF